MSKNSNENLTVTTLPVGTKFYVHNGHWHGQIIEEEGIRYIYIEENGHKFKIDNWVGPLDITTEEEQRRIDEENRINYNKTKRLYDADEACEHDIQPASGGGVKCTKCKGWFCL